MPDKTGPAEPVRLLTPTEAVVAKIWCELLGTEETDPDADFFELGGHSLLAVRAVRRIDEATGVLLDLEAFFEHGSIARIAGELDRLSAAAPAPAEPQGEEEEL